jgi:hypothetical protein
MTQDNLGSVLRRLGERENSIARMEDAVAAHRAAIEVFEQSLATYYVGRTRLELALAEAELAARRSPPSD